MTDKKIERIVEGATIPEFQQVQGEVVERGAPIPTMTPVQSTDNQSGSTQNSGQGTSSSGTQSDGGQASSQSQSGENA